MLFRSMCMLSLMQSAFPKYIYDKNRIKQWTNQVGAAVGVNGGDVFGAARIIEPAQVSPQISMFIESVIGYTQTFLGATPAALGEVRPDNTSAIIALQRASSVPSEITRQSLYQCVEDLGRIWLEFMRAYYGVRTVKAPTPDLTGLPMEVAANAAETMDFDFSVLNDYELCIKLDVGASAYWSEIASMQTLDNLLMNGAIDPIMYLERMPNGYISDQQGLIDMLKARERGEGANSPSVTS